MVLQRNGCVFPLLHQEGEPTCIYLTQISRGSEAAKKRKRTRQKAARIQMSKDERFYHEEHDTLKAYVEDLEEQLADTSLSSREKDRIRGEIATMSTTLERFDAED